MNTPRRNVLKLLGAGTVLGTSLGSGIAAADTQDGDGINWDEVGEAIGKEGERKEDDVYKIEFPRTDLEVSAQDVEIEPALALGSWVGFTQMNESETLLLGDLVLTEDEYNQALSTLQEGGIQQTAIHKHLPDLSTPLWWTHIEGIGDPVELAQTINDALAETDTPMEESGDSEEADLALDTDQLDEIIGHEGEVDSGVYKYSIGLDQSVTTEGVEVPTSMGTATVLGFQPLGDGQAAINGDFAMIADEVNPVIRALRENGIQAVSLHNHMLEEEPQLFFMHFWATDDATTLAEGLRAALDENDSASGG